MNCTATSLQFCNGCTQVGLVVVGGEGGGWRCIHFIGECLNGIHMLYHGVLRPLLHGVKDKVKAMFPCHFNYRKKITVSGDQNDLVSIPSLSEGSNVKSHPHVNALLLHVNTEIIWHQVIDSLCAGEQIGQHAVLQNVGSRALSQFTHAQRHTVLFRQKFVKII